jgi:hypothetical protein
VSGSADRPGRQPACGFCDGTGLWVDPDVGPGATDPCPLCDGTGATRSAHVGTDGAAVPEPVTLSRVVDALAGLSQAERQQLYELLHARYDCRIYRR